MFDDLIRALSPRVRRREAEAAERQRQAEEAQRRRDMAARQEREAKAAAEAKEQAYKAHVRTVDLNGLATKGGRPISVPEIASEVAKRIKLARAVQDDWCFPLAHEMTDAQIEAVVGQLDQTALRWLLEHEDPIRQRQAAEKLLNARADLSPVPKLEDYAVLVGEAAARVRPRKYAHNRISPAVVARAILLRSASTRWDRPTNKGPRPLSDAL